uniref:Uncharacterized protein n=1 Tax=Romanomermis culicivorax TaxID=13658 RepID=A0A915K700_ROMCU
MWLEVLKLSNYLKSIYRETTRTLFIFNLSYVNGAEGKRRKRYIPPDIASKLAEMQKWKDVDWSSIIGRAMNPFVANQLDNIMAYIRFDALHTFRSENEHFLNDLLQEEKKCENLLPVVIDEDCVIDRLEEVEVWDGTIENPKSSNSNGVSQPPPLLSLASAM